MYGPNDADKVLTIRISQSEYDQLKAIVDNRRWHWPRVTVSSKAREMIVYCLNHQMERFKEE